jgi:hypothetical protein
LDVTSTIREASAEGDVTVEASTILSMTHQVVDGQDGRRVLEITRDSSRVRTRPAEGTWVLQEDSGATLTKVRLTIDERMRVLDLQPLTNEPADLVQLATFRAFSTGLEFALPEHPVSRGESWISDIVIPFDDPTGVEEEPGVSTWIGRIGDLIARSTFTLDSLAARGSDTLAFLQLQGTFMPTTISSAAEVAEGRARVSGALSGRLIWSTGWSAFVSGALRSHVRMVTFVGVPGDETPGLSLSVDASSRFQVRW